MLRASIEILMKNKYFYSVKILIVRFSSIGDIVLTSPVVRILNEQLSGVELHFLTKKAYVSIVRSNPRIDKVFTIEKSVDEVIFDLKKEQYDWVIDLHNNIRTRSLKSKLQKPSKTVRKLNWKKWLFVNLKINRMPNKHVVNRYVETIEHLGVRNDNKEPEFYISRENEIDPMNQFGFEHYVSVAIGAQYATKRLSTDKLIEILSQIDLPVVLIGGTSDREVANQICTSEQTKTVVSVCGVLNLQQSASVVKQSVHLLTHDTGMMHIASCFDVSMSVVWGNTVPDFGMHPYLPSAKKKVKYHQVDTISCRPCSKIGYQKCPKGHFKCMQMQDSNVIAESILRK